MTVKEITRIEDLTWTKDGLIPAIAQDLRGRVVMMGWMN